MQRTLLVGLVTFFLGGGWTHARAQSCTVNVSAVDFGVVDPLSQSVVETTLTVAVVCTWPLLSITDRALVCLDFTPSSPRAMVNGPNQMQFELYQDAAHKVPWESRSPIAITVDKPPTFNFAANSTTAYARIAANQPTVPVVNGDNTVYSRSFQNNQTVLTYGFYSTVAPKVAPRVAPAVAPRVAPAVAPTCASLSASAVSTFPFTVQATVVPNCHTTAANINFGTIFAFNSGVSASGEIRVQCTNGLPYKLTLNGGSSGNLAARRLQRVGGSELSSYQLYLDSAHTTVWGDGTGGTSFYNGTGTGLLQSLKVYGTVPAQKLFWGTYNDTITVTNSFSKMEALRTSASLTVDPPQILPRPR